MSAVVGSLGRIAALVLLLLAPGHAHARSLDDKEKAALAATVANFDAAMRDKKYGVVIETIPPRVLQAISSKAGASVEQLRAALIQQIEAAMSTVAITSFSMDLAGAQHKELANGTPYVLIPTRTVIDAGSSGKFTQNSHTLGLIDEGKWYLLRVEEATQVTMLRESYPDFAHVDLPKGKMEIEKK